MILIAGYGTACAATPILGVFGASPIALMLTVWIGGAAATLGWAKFFSVAAHPAPVRVTRFLRPYPAE